MTGYQSHTLAKKYGGISVVAEHRYFGQSKPFGNNSHSVENTEFLNLPNVMMDYVNLIKHIREMYGL